jgi:hypothetical protein
MLMTSHDLSQTPPHPIPYDRASYFSRRNEPGTHFLGRFVAKNGHSHE